VYIKYNDYNGQLQDGDMVLMSHYEFVNGGKEVIGVPVCITPDGNEPKEVSDGDRLEPIPDNI